MGDSNAGLSIEYIIYNNGRLASARMLLAANHQQQILSLTNCVRNLCAWLPNAVFSAFTAQ